MNLFGGRGGVGRGGEGGMGEGGMGGGRDGGRKEGRGGMVGREGRERGGGQWICCH